MVYRLTSNLTMKWEKIIYHNEILSYKCPKCGNYQSYKTKACLLCRTKLGN